MSPHWPGENLLIKLLDTLREGIGATFRPWSIMRDETARIECRRRERLALAQAEKDAEEITKGRKILGPNWSLLATPGSEGHKFSSDMAGGDQLTGPDLLQAHERETDVRSFKRSINLRNIALYAEEEAEAFVDKDNVSEEKVDPDWFARWRSFAEDVSKEDMQRLWGRLLAGEVKNPGSYSIHTLAFLSRMSVSDADLISQLAPFRVDNMILADSLDLLEKQGITFNKLIYLDEINVISSITKVRCGKIVHCHEDKRYVRLDFGKLCMVLFTDHSHIEQLEVDVYPISLIGCEIMSLATFEINTHLLNRMVDLAANRGFTKAQIGRIEGNAIVDLRDFYTMSDTVTG